MNQKVPPPRTRAEATDHRETSRHAEVLAFLRALTPRTRLMKVESMGSSALGQDMPVAVLSSDGTFTPEAARRKKKLVVMVLANIHAGEVEGKEALLMLAREFTLKRPPPFLKNLVLVFVPDYNPDGNDRIDRNNRKLDLKKLDGQVGPEGGVGTRYTGREINLNRDYMKMEAHETRHLSKLFGRWRPHVFVDCHTTDGSIHGYDLTYDTSHNPESSPAGPIRFTRDEFLPEIGRRLRKRTGHRTFFYGNWKDQDDPSKGWETYPALPRYGSHYRGLAGRVDILLEAYSYIDFKSRTDVMLAILQEIFRLANERRSAIRAVVERAEQETVARGADPQPDDTIGINYGTAHRDGQNRLVYAYPADPFPEPVTCEGWDLASQKERLLPGRKRAQYRGPHYARFVPQIRVRRPFAYLIPRERVRVADHLRMHNVAVEELAADASLEGESYVVLAREATVSPDVGSMERFETVFWTRKERRTLQARAGDFVVRMAQPAAHIALYLLEPESDDGLVRWNFFDELLPGATYPIARIPRPLELRTAATR